MVELMRRNVDINMDTDWKIVTLFMGGNDLCRYCNHGIGDPEVSDFCHTADSSRVSMVNHLMVYLYCFIFSGYLHVLVLPVLS